MEKVQIDLGKDSYTIHIGKDLLNDVESFLGIADSFFIITDQNVDSLYGNKLQRGLKNKKYYQYIIAPGEDSKNMETITSILSCMLESNLTRRSMVIAFGGGVVGDIAGFCASIYMRGIPFIQVPTTLLAQVDSSVGGKTGVNLPQAKNSIGTFYQPKGVVIDTSLLYTLTPRELLSGIGEIIKYGIIKDYHFFQYLQENIERIKELDDTILQYVIKRCCEIKAAIVAQDEKELGVRKILNFGHTIGHGLEGITRYQKYTHGEAVLLGMYYETILARNLGVIEESYFFEIIDFIQKFDINLDISSYPIQQLIDIMIYDKKNHNDKISFILPTKKGIVEEYLLEKSQIHW
jgi:3-dehydroquinate synthase